MSGKLMERVARIDGMDLHAKIVLLHIAALSDDRGRGCVAGQTTLASRCGISERSTWRALADLALDGLIRRERRHRANGSRTSDAIVVTLPPAGATCRLDRTARRPEGGSLPAPDASRTGGAYSQTTTDPTRKPRQTLLAPRATQEVRKTRVQRPEERESAQNRDDSSNPRRPREPKPRRNSLSEPEIDTWTTEAATLRPDLTTEQIAASYTVFKDHYPSGQQTHGKWRTWINREDPTRTTKRGTRVGRERNAARLFEQDHPHEAIDSTLDLDPATAIDSTCRVAPD